MRAVLMAGGDGTRWGNYMGVPKHVVPIDGERLIDCTVRKLREGGVTEVVVVGPYDVPGAVTALPTHTACDTDKFLSTQPHWHRSAQTLIMYGDVWFSDAALAALAEPVADFRFVGRPGHSSITGSAYGELFGVALSPARHGYMLDAIENVRRLLLRGQVQRGGGWELYRRCVGLSLREHKLNGHFRTVDDWTEDFDFPQDYVRWMERSGRAGE